MLLEIPPAWQASLKFKQSPRVMSAAILHEMAARTEQDKVGGALFRNPHYWQQLVPHTKSARWQQLGGVDFRLRRVKQQGPVQARPKNAEEKMAIAEEMTSLITMGVYEEVPDTEREEDLARDFVISGEWEELQKKSRSLTASGRRPMGVHAIKSTQLSEPRNVLANCGSRSRRRAKKKEKLERR